MPKTPKEIAEIVGLSPEQTKIMIEAIGESWPKFTKDPAVNYAVDCFQEQEDAIPIVAFDSLPKETKEIYIKEIETSW